MTEIDRSYPRRPNHYTKQKDKKSSSRKCQVCGRNPWPNYFFCIECHTVASRSLDIRDLNSGGFHPVGV